MTKPRKGDGSRAVPNPSDDMATKTIRIRRKNFTTGEEFETERTIQSLPARPISKALWDTMAESHRRFCKPLEDHRKEQAAADALKQDRQKLQATSAEIPMPPSCADQGCTKAMSRGHWCRKHYLNKVLKVREHQAGNGKAFRPFADWELPLDRMSDLQHEALRVLPVSTALSECIERMNTLDPANPVAANQVKPARSSRKPRH